MGDLVHEDESAIYTPLFKSTPAYVLCHLRHTRGALIVTGSPGADMRCTASSFVISVVVCGDHTVEAYSNWAALMLYRLRI